MFDEQGVDVVKYLKKYSFDGIDSLLIPTINSQDFATTMLEDTARKLLCFSLSERQDSAPMWAHYASNHVGFVVAFDTRDRFFNLRKDGKPTKLQQVKYFDGKVEEPLDDLRAALISKTTAWTYEQEWRLYKTLDQADRLIEGDDDTIHLFNFQKSAVQRVIVGAKASDETVDSIRAILQTYPQKPPLLRARADRISHRIFEDDL